MKNHDLVWAGHCRDDKSDKIWGIFTVNKGVNINVHVSPEVYIFWGKRGGVLNFKKDNYNYELQKIQKTKAKRYVKVDEKTLFHIWPNFEQALNERLTFCVLSDMVR